MQGLVEALRTEGYQVDSLWDLVHSGRRYRSAVPILIQWLRKTAEIRDKESIVRALSVPWASEATPALIAEFENHNDPGGSYLWAVGNALEVLWDDRDFENLAKIARDRGHGAARQMVVLGFGKSKSPEAVPTLLGLLDDPAVNGHATSALAKLKDPSSRDALELMSHDARAWVRSAAKRGLHQIPPPA